MGRLPGFFDFDEVAEAHPVDMGGTSFDIGIILDGAPALTSEGNFEAFPVKIQQIDVHAISAGSSIAWIDRGGALNGSAERAVDAHGVTAAADQTNGHRRESGARPAGPRVLPAAR